MNKGVRPFNTDATELSTSVSANENKKVGTKKLFQSNFKKKNLLKEFH